VKYLYILFVVFFSVANVNAQKTPRKATLSDDGKVLTKDTGGFSNRHVGGDSKTTKAIKVDTKATDYKFISITKDTTYVDTTLSIQKEYKYNYLRKDYFELLPFSNAGRVFNQLGYDFSDTKNTFSLFGARAKHADYAEVNAIKYYNVATPFTEVFFKTTMEQGQLADVFFTINTTPNFNIAAAYKGLRSIGKYRHEKTEGGQFKLSLNYNTKNKRYFAKAHVVMQRIAHQENGGIDAQGVIEFEDKNDEFSDRSRFEVNFTDADNKLSAKRFYINHYYQVTKPQDSIVNYVLNVGHISNLEDKKYEFDQATANAFFGDAFSSKINDEVRLEKFYNQGYVSFAKQKIGEITAHIGYTDYNYGYNRIVNLITGNIPNRLKGRFASYGAAYKNNYGKLKIQANFKANLSNQNSGSVLGASIKYQVKDSISIAAKITLKDALPNFNYRLYQSDYKNYNWYNPNFLNVKTKTIGGVIDAKKYATLSASFSTIDNYTYFGLNTAGKVQPYQTTDVVTYLKVNLQKEVRFLRHFAIDNTLQYQKVTQNAPALFTPKYIIRNTLYYQNTFFKKNLFLQTGVIFNYFGKYKMNAYDPLLGEFYNQTAKEYGEYPRFDVFVNAKVRNARIYLKAEQLNTVFTGNTFYSAPNYPYKDFTIRFGLVWDFFL